MKMLKLEVLDPRAIRPCNNPFGVKCIEAIPVVQGFINIVKTGVKIELPDDLTLMVIPAVNGLTIMGWYIAEDGLRMIVCGDNSFHGFPLEGPFAFVFINEPKPAKVRFVEFAKEGGRIVCGDAKERHA